MARAQRRPALQTNHPLYDLAHKKWGSSGLSAETATKLLLRPMTAAEVQEILKTTKPQAGGVLLPYFDLDGNPTGFFRIRYLEKLPGFAGLVEKPQRYVQPAGTLNEVYLPPLLDMTWREVAITPTRPVYITEGEFKAASGCDAGLATIGLGGVDVFRSTKRGIELLPQLEAIKWTNRPVVIVFDSDAATNPNVVRAQRQLAQVLVARGAIPSIASLPAAKDGSKQGLDDFLVANGAEALLEILKDAPAFPEAAALWEMNEEVVYVKNPGLVINIDTGQRMDPNRFSAHHYANRHYLAIEQKANGMTTAKKKPLAKHWIEWEHRAEVEKVTYAPGKDKLIDGTLNVWPGWGVVPVKGDISPWVWLLDHIFKGKPAERKWFEQWCAYPLQHPGVKLFTYVILWSVAQGTGKSFISYALKAIYGKNGVEVGNDALRAGFNAWQENKQFVVGDEITAGGEARLDADKLKRMICQPEIRVNQKFIPEYYIPDCINYLFNSNHPDALFFEDRDRRGFVHRLPDEKMTEEFWQDANRWLNKDDTRKHDGPGPARLFHHLLYEVDLTGFNPSAPAPMTAAKQEMILHGKSDVGLWVIKLLEDPTTALMPLGERTASGCDLFTPANLLFCYDPEKKGRVHEPGLGKILTSSGFTQVNEQQPIRTKVGLVRLYAVRNVEKWRNAKPAELAAHYNSFFAEGPK